MQANVAKSGIFAGDDPGARQIFIRFARLGPGNDKAADARNGFQDFERGIGQVDRAWLVRLAIGQANDAPIPVNVIPFDGGDFA